MLSFAGRLPLHQNHQRVKVGKHVLHNASALLLGLLADLAADRQTRVPLDGQEGGRPPSSTCRATPSWPSATSPRPPLEAGEVGRCVPILFSDNKNAAHIYMYQNICITVFFICIKHSATKIKSNWFYAILSCILNAIWEKLSILFRLLFEC